MRFDLVRALICVRSQPPKKSGYRCAKDARVTASCKVPLGRFRLRSQLRQRRNGLAAVACQRQVAAHILARAVLGGAVRRDRQMNALLPQLPEHEAVKRLAFVFDVFDKRLHIVVSGGDVVLAVQHLGIVDGSRCGIQFQHGTAGAFGRNLQAHVDGPAVDGAVRFVAFARVVIDAAVVGHEVDHVDFAAVIFHDAVHRAAERRAVLDFAFFERRAFHVVGSCGPAGDGNFQLRAPCLDFVVQAVDDVCDFGVFGTTERFGCGFVAVAAARLPVDIHAGSAEIQRQVDDMRRVEIPPLGALAVRPAAHGEPRVRSARIQCGDVAAQILGLLRRELQLTAARRGALDKLKARNFLIEGVGTFDILRIRSGERQVDIRDVIRDVLQLQIVDAGVPSTGIGDVPAVRGRRGSACRCRHADRSACGRNVAGCVLGLHGEAVGRRGGKAGNESCRSRDAGGKSRSLVDVIARDADVVRRGYP